MLGYAFQNGLIPLSEAALDRAIELNAVAVEANKQAFLWGRRAAVDLERVERIAAPARSRWWCSSRTASRRWSAGGSSS